LVGKRLLLFSYGSGALSTLFSIRVKRSVIPAIRNSDIYSRLSRRIFFNPEAFSKVLSTNEQRYENPKDYVPNQPLDQLSPGTYYLTKIDMKYQRFYERLTTCPVAKL